MDSQLDPLVGRDGELERVVQILCRRTKNNPVLITELVSGQNRHRRRISAADCRRRSAVVPRGQANSSA